MRKKSFLNVSLAAGFLLVAASCGKRVANVAPDPDTEFQSTVDVSYAAQVITDIEMICGFAGQADLSPKFYMSAPGVPPPVITRDDIAKFIYVSYNNTKCVDGRVRDGSIAMYYGYTNPNAKYYYDFEFEGKVSLLNYKVDKWAVEVSNSFIIKNQLPSPQFNSSQTKLSWSVTGEFTLKHPTNASKNMRCNVDLVKTLANTNDKAVYNATKLAAITWSLAQVEYTGKMTGETAANVPFTYSINTPDPLVRDFTCYPEKISGVELSVPVKPEFEEYHPFVKGRVVFKTNDLYPRDISYGDEQNVYGDVKNAPATLSAQCDNKGIVTIKGISYPIDFAKEYK